MTSGKDGSRLNENGLGQTAPWEKKRAVNERDAPPDSMTLPGRALSERRTDAGMAARTNRWKPAEESAANCAAPGRAG